MAKLTALGPFSLAESARFLCGFTPASGSAGVDERGRLVLGFLSDRFEPAVARVSDDLEIEGDAHEQVARILSLDVDGRPMEAIARRDPVIGKLLSARKGFRPVVFPSAYEAAIWGVLAQRVSMRMASAVKRKLSEHTRSSVTGFGQTFFPSPPPKKLLDLRSFPSLPDEKLVRLKGIARAALEGRLDVARLRAMPERDALDDLRTLRGVGEWTAAHILYRGCGATDALPLREPRVLRGIAEAYGLARAPSKSRARAIAEVWRPLRMWIAVLVVSNLRNTARWHGAERRAG
jgi:DNA-3-methyladenine glycosylase II